MKKIEKQAVEAFDKSKEYYQMMRSWHRKGSQEASLEKEVRDLLITEGKGRVLDAGCGEGALVLWILKHCKVDEIFGVDVSSAGVRMAQKSVRDKRVHFKKANLKKLPFQRGFFDLIVCHSVLEHVVDYPDALKEFFRVLKPKGKLLIRLGNEYKVSRGRFLWNCIFRLNKAIPIRPSLKLKQGSFKDHMHNFDVNEITSDVLLQDVKKAGFRIRYFSTGFKSYRKLPEYRDEPWYKKGLISLLAYFPVFPLNHLGGLIIIMGEKP